MLERQRRGGGEDSGSPEPIAVHELTAELQAPASGTDKKSGGVCAVEQQHHRHGVGRHEPSRCPDAVGVSDLDVEVRRETVEGVRGSEGRSQQSPAFLAVSDQLVGETWPHQHRSTRDLGFAAVSGQHRTARQPASGGVAGVESGDSRTDVGDERTEVNLPVGTVDDVLVLDSGPAVSSGAPHDLPVERPVQRGALSSGAVGSRSSGSSRRRRSRPSSMRWSAARSTTLSWIVCASSELHGHDRASCSGHERGVAELLDGQRVALFPHDSLPDRAGGTPYLVGHPDAINSGAC